MPFSAATIGHLNSPQAMRYGWGYSPHAAIDLLDPDTGEVYQDRTNSHGWRDKERTLNINNTRKSFRIVVIGDSCTFGAIVPADKIYTRLLENKLTGKGYNVEVINISYGGWDAEQELEALKNEGLLYHPNLIILQFCTNDLGGAACSENPALSAANAKLQKPFYYRFGENGGLVRERNDYFYKVYVRSFENRLRSLVYHSEILKRLHYLSVVFRTQGVHAPRNNTVYRITNDNLLRFRLVFQLDQNDPVIASLKGLRGRTIDEEDIHKILSSKIAAGKQPDKALRIFEDRWFNNYWYEDCFYGDMPGRDSCKWRLYFAILLEMKRLALESGADFAVLSDQEIGAYRWSVYWGRISESPLALENYLSPTELIKEFAESQGNGFIENRREVIRAHNDPHPNIEGNEAMAGNIYQFLMENYGSTLVQYNLKNAIN